MWLPGIELRTFGRADSPGPSCPKSIETSKMLSSTWRRAKNCTANSQTSPANWKQLRPAQMPVRNST
ncbi:hypothetical protein LEMLEM_LOCUS26088 [Lemmus lemmus]